jgi:hypothetical protein
MTDYVVTGLVKRRAEIAGQIEAVHEQLKKLLADLEAIDSALGVFDPSIVAETIKPKAIRPPSDWASYGQTSRIALNILRSSSEPLTTRDVALQMLVERALNKDDQRLLRLMTKRVGVALRHQRDQNIVRSSQGPGMFMLWEIRR